MLDLRPYQRSAIDALYTYFGVSTGNPLICMPTGTGKSVVIAGFMRDALEAYPETRILMLTHVKELIQQNYMALLRVWPGAPAGIYSAGLSRRDIRAQILFAGIQSIHKRAAQVQRCDLVIVDEAHLISRNDSGMYRSFLAELQRMNGGMVKVIGFTATPYRMDSGMLHEGKDRIFTDIAFEVPMLEMMGQGYLCPVIPKKTTTQLDVGGVGTRGGEFIAGQLEAAVDQDHITAAAVSEIIQHGEGRGSWLVFCSGVSHARHVRDAIRERGFTAETVTGDTTPAERDQFLAGYKAGRIRCLTNANVLTTGFDAPGTDLVALLRPTKSVGLYVQMVGRGTRLAPGKEDCVVLDFAGNTARHGPVDTVDGRRKEQGEDGEAPVKTCPECQTINHAAVRICTECGHEFPPPEIKVAAQAATHALLSSQLQPVWTKVDDISYSIHNKPNKPPTLVAFTHPDLGWADKPFRIVGWTYEPSTGEVAVELQEENAFSYGWLWDYASTVPAVPDTTLIDPLTLPVPAAPSLTATTVLNADGAAVPAIEVAWSSPAHAFVTNMEVQWREAAGVWVSMTVDVAVGRATISPAISGITYDVRTRHLAALARSGWSTTSSLAALADTTAPGAPEFPSAAGRAMGIDVAWVAPADLDVAYFELEERVDTTGSSWSQVATTGATRYARLGLAPGDAKRYRVRAIDRSGNLGAWSAEAAGVAGAVVDGDIAVDAVTTETIVADAVTTFASTSGFTTIPGDDTSYLAMTMSFSVPDARVGTLTVSLQHGYGSEVAHAVDIYVDGSLYATRGSAAIADYATFAEPMAFTAGTHWIDIWWSGQPGMELNRRNMTLIMRSR
jgi:DNA repair protein RadD